MITVDQSKCTGCGACVQVCPKQCISWQKVEFDFRYPSVDETACVHCGRCNHACPIGKPLPAESEQHAYAVICRDPDVLWHSTSGGAFSVIADFVLDRCGVVYGCSMEDGLKVQHIRVTDRLGLAKLRGSKYVQSDIGHCFIQVEDDLKQGRQVLFSGTPCQIAGLQGFLNRHYENLITVDVVCHGVGSQAYFDKYLTHAKAQYGSIDTLRFRDKAIAGWSVGGSVVSNKKLKPYYDYNNYYYYYFLHGDIYRNSCYSCPYAGTTRVSDFTLADFWGIESLDTGLDTRNGCSLLLTNTNKANELLKHFQNATVREVSIAQAVRMNAQLRHPTADSPIREKLAAQYRSMTAGEIHRDFCRTNRKNIAKLKLKSLIPYPIRRRLRKLR